jgi:hypothetical protein
VRRVATIVLVVALLGGTAAAFAVTEALKLERSPVTAPRFDEVFSPVCDCPNSVAQLRLRFRVEDRVDAAILDSGDDVVRILEEDRPVRRGRATFRWDGRDDAGELAPDGEYRLRLHLDQERRTIVIPNEVELDTEVPSVRVVRVSTAVVSPDGDRKRDRIKLGYAASEAGGAILLVDGEVVLRERPRGRRGAIIWDGRIDGRPAEPGVYALALEFRDLAGNVSDPTEPVPVRLRYVVIRPNVIHTPVGGVLRFRVDTDARSFQYSLRRAASGAVAFAAAAESPSVNVRLPSGVRPGRYVLQVAANRNVDTAGVIVGARP